MLPLTEEEQQEYSSTNVVCHICKQPFIHEETKCRDHDHLTGRFRGASHQACNLNYRINPDKIQIPCFFHNLKNYDAHILISEAKPHHGAIKVIPTTTEKYISFTIGDIRFKDSYAFTQASLESLANNLEINQFVNTRRWLEQLIVENENDVSSEEEEDEEPSLSDMEFIDDRKRKHVFLESKDDDQIKHRRLEDVSDEDEDSTSNDDDEEDNISNDEIMSDNDDDEEDNIEQIEYKDAMAEFDYRRSPYQQPKLTREQIQQVNEDLQLLKSKGIYPYEYFDSFERFKEHELPPIEAFNSQLNAGTCITIEEYNHAKKVFSHFEMETLQDYHNLYLLQDIFLLDDILTAFRTVCLNTYGLDPMHYHTAPGLTWDAGLKYTGVTLELITDKEKYLFIEAGIRGGISVISHRHEKVNHPIHANINFFNSNELNRQMLYLDANN